MCVDVIFGGIVKNRRDTQYMNAHICTVYLHSYYIFYFLYARVYLRLFPAVNA